MVYRWSMGNSSIKIPECVLGETLKYTVLFIGNAGWYVYMHCHHVHKTNIMRTQV